MIKYDNCREKYGFEFYVIDDLNKSGYHMEHFDKLMDAVNFFCNMDGSNGKMPALGFQVGTSGLDLMYKINERNVLVPDYKKMDVMSEDMQGIETPIFEAVKRLVDEGFVNHELANALLPKHLANGLSVVVPVSLGTFDLKDSYCKDKVLKTTNKSGLDAIDSLFVEGHGWVAYQSLCFNPEVYCKDGVLKVDMLNVCYVLEKNLVGIDGRMDIKPSDFLKMVEDINKPYHISVYDENEYKHQYENQHNFIVASFDTLPEAVKAWYDIEERVKVTPGVVDKASGSCVFNGSNGDLEYIPREDAAKVYGFVCDNEETKKSIDDIIHEATRVSETSGSEIKNEKDIEFDK